MRRSQFVEKIQLLYVMEIRKFPVYDEFYFRNGIFFGTMETLILRPLLTKFYIAPLPETLYISQTLNYEPFVDIKIYI